MKIIHRHHKQQLNGRICNKCGEFKSLLDFQRNGFCADGSVRYRSVCKACGSKFKLVETASTKTCCRCGRIYSPIPAFGPQGVWSECRRCRTDRKAKWLKTDKGKALVARARSRLVANGYYKSQANVQKRRARSALNAAVHSGKIVKPLSCEICGAIRRIHGHHKSGYGKDHYLDVIWLCAKCHYKVEVGTLLLE